MTQVDDADAGERADTPLPVVHASRPYQRGARRSTRGDPTSGSTDTRCIDPMPPPVFDGSVNDPGPTQAIRRQVQRRATAEQPPCRPARDRPLGRHLGRRRDPRRPERGARWTRRLHGRCARRPGRAVRDHRAARTQGPRPLDGGARRAGAHRCRARPARPLAVGVRARPARRPRARAALLAARSPDGRGDAILACRGGRARCDADPRPRLRHRGALRAGHGPRDGAGAAPGRAARPRRRPPHRRLPGGRHARRCRHAAGVARHRAAGAGSRRDRGRVGREPGYGGCGRSARGRLGGASITPELAPADARRRGELGGRRARAVEPRSERPARRHARAPRRDDGGGRRPRCHRRGNTDRRAWLDATARGRNEHRAGRRRSGRRRGHRYRFDALRPARRRARHGSRPLRARRSPPACARDAGRTRDRGAMRRQPTAIATPCSPASIVPSSRPIACRCLPPSRRSSAASSHTRSPAREIRDERRDRRRRHPRLPGDLRRRPRARSRASSSATTRSIDAILTGLLRRRPRADRGRARAPARR